MNIPTQETSPAVPRNNSNPNINNNNNDEIEDDDFLIMNDDINLSGGTNNFSLSKQQLRLESKLSDSLQGLEKLYRNLDEQTGITVMQCGHMMHDDCFTAFFR